MPPFVTVLCLATIILQLAAAGCGFHFAATGEPAFGLMGLVFGLLSFASLAYYLWIADVIEAPPSKRWKKLSGRLDTTSGRMLAVLVFLLLLLLLAAMYLFADLWFPSADLWFRSMDARQGFFPLP